MSRISTDFTEMPESAVLSDIAHKLAVSAGVNWPEPWVARGPQPRVGKLPDGARRAERF